MRSGRLSEFGVGGKINVGVNIPPPYEGAVSIGPPRPPSWAGASSLTGTAPKRLCSRLKGRTSNPQAVQARDTPRIQVSALAPCALSSQPALRA